MSLASRNFSTKPLYDFFEGEHAFANLSLLSIRGMHTNICPNTKSP